VLGGIPHAAPTGRPNRASLVDASTLAAVGPRTSAPGGRPARGAGRSRGMWTFVWCHARRRDSCRLRGRVVVLATTHARPADRSAPPCRVVVSDKRRELEAFGKIPALRTAGIGRAPPSLAPRMRTMASIRGDGGHSGDGHELGLCAGQGRFRGAPPAGLEPAVVTTIADEFSAYRHLYRPHGPSWQAHS
jgi:hypothetical protein